MNQSTQIQRATTTSGEIQHDLVESALNKACDADPGLANVVRLVGYPEPRTRNPGFATLVEIINAQQLSTRAAASIWGRLKKLNGGVITPRKIRNRTEQQLRLCGLSGRKIDSIKGLAEKVISKELQLDTLSSLPDQEAIAELVKVKGMGQWSAEIYVMFALGRQDIFPANDLALQIAVQRYKNLSNRPDVNQTREISEIWSPYRSAVAVLMWKYYGATTLGDN
jgi:DNA-3-methyladenine glycosylase II